VLNGITRSKYCGGFAEALEAFTIATEKFSLEKILNYAKKLGDSAERRLEWVLDNIGISNELMAPLTKKSHKRYIKLNASGEKKVSLIKSGE
jgi:predicted transcriptional regulator of viral defense system